MLSSEDFTLKEQAKKEVNLAIETDLRTRDRPDKGKGKASRTGDNGATGRTGRDATRADNDRRDTNRSPDRRRSRTPYRQRQNNNQNDRRDTHNASRNDTRYGPLVLRPARKGRGKNGNRR